MAARHLCGQGLERPIADHTQMAQELADVNLVLPEVLSAADQADAINLFCDVLKPLGLSVADTGLRGGASSIAAGLEFIISIVHNPALHGSAIAVESSPSDLLLRESVKTILGKIVGGKKNSLFAIYVSLAQRFPGRRIEVSITTPDGINYLFGLDEAEEAVPTIANDFAKERHGPRSPRRRYFNGGWLPAEEYLAAFHARQRAERPE